MFVGIIYKYTSPSGKVYIGQTRNEQSRRQRWLAQFVKGKDNHVFRNFIWKEIL